MDEEQLKDAYKYAIALLTKKDYSHFKLIEKLRSKKFDQEVIAAVIEELDDHNYIREDLYLEARIKAFMHKNYSKKFILQKLELEKATVTMEDIDSVFDDYKLTEDEQIENLIKKKLPSNFAEIGDYETKEKISNRAIRHALSKGHDMHKILSAIKHFKSTKY